MPVVSNQEVNKSALTSIAHAKVCELKQHLTQTITRLLRNSLDACYCIFRKILCFHTASKICLIFENLIFRYCLVLRASDVEFNQSV